MVDLAKIRKKKAEGRKQKAEPAGVSPLAPTPAPETAPPDHSWAGVAPGVSPGITGTTETTQTTTSPTTSKLDRFKQDAGKRRGVEASKVEIVAPEAQLELLTFLISGEQYAIDIERIVEIVTPRPITRIPNADRGVVGIISLRGTIVTLVDVRAKLRHPAASSSTDDTRIVVIDLRGEIVGFAVDRVLRVVKVAATEVGAHPVVHASEQEESIRGVFRVANALTILLDLDKLLASRALATTVV